MSSRQWVFSGENLVFVIYVIWELELSLVAKNVAYGIFYRKLSLTTFKGRLMAEHIKVHGGKSQCEDMYKHFFFMWFEIPRISNLTKFKKSDTTIFNFLY